MPHPQAFSVLIIAERHKLFLFPLFGGCNLALDSTFAADLQSCQSVLTLV